MIRIFKGNQMGNVAGGARKFGCEPYFNSCYIALENEAEKNAYIQYLRSIDYSEEDAIRNGMTHEEFVDDWKKEVFAKPGRRVTIPGALDEYDEFKQFCKSNPIFGAGVHFKN